MKNLLFFSSFAISIFLFESCESPIGLDDLDPIPVSDIPDSVLDFIASQYGEYEIQEVQLEDICDDQIVFEVELEDGPTDDIDLYFDEDWNFLFTSTEIDQAELPDEIKQAIEAFNEYILDEDTPELWHYPGDTLKFKLEFTDSSEEIDIELILNEDGSIYCMTDDDDDSNDSDDDDGDHSSMDQQIPDTISTFIQEAYPGYDIEEFEKEDLCAEDEYYYAVELEDGPNGDIELYFSLSWEFLFEMVEIKSDDLPDAVFNAIGSNNNDYEIEDDDVYQLNWQDGTTHYLIELDGEGSLGEDPEIIFSSDGSVICADD